MALKFKVSKDDHGKLEEGMQKLYIEDGDGGFRLDVDSEGDTGALKRAKDREVQLRKEAEARAREAQEKLDALTDGDIKKRGDVDALDKSWQSKHEKTVSEYQAKIDKFMKSTEKNLREGTARTVAAKISTAPDLLHPHLLSRLAVDYDGDEPKLRVLDQNGQPSAMTLDELSAEFVANKNYSAIMTASKASGGGGANAHKSGPSFQGSAQQRGDVNLSTMSMSEKVAYFKQIREQNGK